jgi:hypothetical protein
MVNLMLVLNRSFSINITVALASIFSSGIVLFGYLSKITLGYSGTGRTG